MDDMIPIGHFSRMSRLSIKALRFYDEQGLLIPARVDPSSGYRYYRRSQARQAEAIRVLRQTDMPIGDIRDVLSSDDPEIVSKRLQDHRERLRSRLAEQERMLRFLEQLIDRGGYAMPYQVTTRQIGSRPVAALRLHTILPTIGADMARGFSTLVSAIGTAGASPSGAPFVIYHNVIDERVSGDIEICIPVPVGIAFAEGPVVFREVPGGPAAVIVHQGPHAEISPAYHEAFTWIEAHGRKPAGPPCEVYLNDPQTVAPEELLTEVQFPIDRL
ncbi:MerR family transcriptional regulator [Actinoplanes hulinensis]|uniref:MerR family transcriptional regulator n=1 Tax=Actinoplanes hulinensis TaxID=1144547 RepID=A0ABS7AZS1_9ACTN|nr:MerR family transcriptional regulator [Actinoplanes hulinensis]MBW6433568.1 MerR family transcriptional regulator [Actinoplanes hulinensis]